MDGLIFSGVIVRTGWTAEFDTAVKGDLVARGRVELPQPYGYQNLNLARLPIPPSGRCLKFSFSVTLRRIVSLGRLR